MTKNFISDGVLVYDRYYCAKPNTPLLVIKRIILAVVFCVSSMMFILTQYLFPVSLPAMAVLCGISCAVFSTILVFIKKRWLVVGTLSVSSVFVWLNFGILCDKLSYFADAFLLLTEGRFLYPRSILFHRSELLNIYNSEYVNGVILGTILMCILYSWVVSLCFSGKIRPFIPALICIVLCVPILISEHIEFNLWLIPALASLAGAFAICRNYSSGLAVKHSSLDDYRRRMRLEERSFLKHISSAPWKKRTEMRCNYYSKYFSSGVYCAILITVSLLLGTVVIPEGGSMDYSGVYNFFAGLSESKITQSPFESGSASEYFSHGGSEESQLLNIISPGRGEREMLRVTYDGSRPIYLRGDIGVDFTGSSWTTVVGSEPKEWRTSGLKTHYRPCENRVINALLTANSDGEINSATDGEAIICEEHVNIEYLCNTDVVFLPPYTVDFSFYNNESFDVYGDYAVRVSDSAGSHINSVECVALIPSYTSNEMYNGDADGLFRVEECFESAYCEPNDIYSSVVSEMQMPDILADYERFVRNTYLSIPDEYSQEIDSYIDRYLINDVRNLNAQRNSENLSEVQYRYRLASLIADHLRTNYTYSLDGGNNSSEPVLQFLNETKRGHCSLYASAMTLILRECGIPARYCTGFYVESPDNSGSVLLREKNLHAWVEVYLGQLGWVTFDPTSSAAYPDRGEQNLDTGESSEKSNETTDEAVVSTDSVSDESVRHSKELYSDEMNDNSAQPSLSQEGDSTAEASGASFFSLIAPYIPLIISALIVVSVIVLLLVRLNSLKNAARAELSRLKSSNGTSREIYLLILSLLELLEITPGRGELPRDFWKRVDEKYGTGLADENDILEAMEFGDRESCTENQIMLYTQLELILSSERPFRFPCKIRILKLICSRGMKNIQK